MKHFLTVIVPDQKAIKYALKGEIIRIGRAEENAITIDVKAVSSRHLEIRKTETGYAVVDLNSTNGTTVNGEPISEHALTDGDDLIIGTAVRAQYACVADESTSATAPAQPLQPKVVAPTAQPAAPTVVLQQPSQAPAAAQSSESPTSGIRVRKMTPPGVDAPTTEIPDPQSTETEDEEGRSEAKIPNGGQRGAGPKKLNFG